MRLSPLLHVQTVLIEHLACQFDDPSLVVAAHQFSIDAKKSTDFVVRSNTSLKGFLGKKQNKGDTAETHSRARLDIHEVDAVLEGCRDDMIVLWKDPVVREILHRRDVRLEEGPGSLFSCQVARFSF
jgi:guanine nucleotide-binding protein alpha-1 subunit